MEIFKIITENWDSSICYFDTAVVQIIRRVNLKNGYLSKFKEIVSSDLSDLILLLKYLKPSSVIFSQLYLIINLNKKKILGKIQRNRLKWLNIF